MLSRISQTEKNKYHMDTWDPLHEDPFFKRSQKSQKNREQNGGCQGMGKKGETG